MKKLVSSLIVGFIIAGCSSRLPLSDGQKASLSQEASKHLEEQKATRYPGFIDISASQIEEAASGFEKSEAIIEDGLITKYGLIVEKTSMGGVPVQIITPPIIASQYAKAAGFNVHGGGFIMGTARDRTALLMAGELGLKIYSVDYTHAPKASFPVPVNQSLEVYKVIEKQFGGQNIITLSSSAGGQILLEMLLKAKKENINMPKAQILFCPNTDLSFDGDSGDANDGRDYLAKGTSVKVVKKFYLKEHDAKDPAVSPVYATYPPDFPGSVIITSTRDLTMSGAVRIHWKFKEANVESELLVADGLWHGYHWDYDMPESKATFREVKKFMDKQFPK